MGKRPNLWSQTRIVMSMFKCGQRKVWFDPTRLKEIQVAKTRASLKNLIAAGIIVDKSKFQQRKGWKIAQMLGRDEEYDTFEKRWYMRPIKQRAAQSMPRENRKRRTGSQN
mmetsp:Transcript_384/g.532  ORF Transcript_384/g.532 Transcript_384/m.532 type:complete len:111 (+) Transcript_384:33-365(+)